MADIEATARRIFEAWKTRVMPEDPTPWRQWLDADLSERYGGTLPGRDTFRIMAGASLPPITGTLDLSQEDQVMVESY